MSPRRRVILLLLIMSLIVVVVQLITIGSLYRAALAGERDRLRDTAVSQARMIEAVARFDAQYSNDYPEGSTVATLSQIIDAHSHYCGFGNTGEFTLSRREGDEIVFLLNHRHYDLDKPKPVAWDSELAEPMRLALSGKSGTIIGKDYRGETVLAAFEPVDFEGLGIVAKIDLEEIRKPFRTAVLHSSILATIIILVGAGIFLKITNPIITELHETVSDLEKTLGEVKTLRGIVPICSYCKKIRDDKGYWDQVEVYVRDHTEAEFSHGICPDCLKEHYPELET